MDCRWLIYTQTPSTQDAVLYIYTVYIYIHSNAKTELAYIFSFKVASVQTSSS